MNKLSVEKKLELLNQIRFQNEKDRLDMSKREHLLYGKTTISSDTDFSLSGEENEKSGIQTLFLRTLLSIGLFLLIIICDLSGKSFWGIPSEECFQTLSKDYESSIITWINAASDNTVFQNYPDEKLPDENVP